LQWNFSCEISHEEEITLGVGKALLLIGIISFEIQISALFLRKHNAYENNRKYRAQI
jgi:hypothetical protein